MLCDVALFGEVKLPDSSIDDFLCAETREGMLPGVPVDAAPTLPRSIEAVLEELRTWPVMAPEYLQVTFEGGKLEVKGLLSRDTFLALAPGLVSVCRTAAPYGGGGTVLMVGLDALNFGWSARCAYGKSSVRVLNTEAIELLRDSPALAGLRQAARGSLETLLGEGAGAPFTGAV